MAASKHNAFNMVEFSPQGATGSEFFLDEVTFHWQPGIMFQPPGGTVLIAEGFESMESMESSAVAAR